jgi:hypothetical protein
MPAVQGSCTASRHWGSSWQIGGCAEWVGHGTWLSTGAPGVSVVQRWLVLQALTFGVGRLKLCRHSSCSCSCGTYTTARRFVTGTCPKCKYEDARGDQVWRHCGLGCLHIMPATNASAWALLKVQVLVFELTQPACPVNCLLCCSATPAARCSTQLS